MKIKWVLICIYFVFAISMLISYISVKIVDYEFKYTVDFVNRICITPNYRYMYTTCEEMVVNINHETVNVPMNFDTDLASIPRIAWSIMPPQFSSFVMPAILHDYLYACPANLLRKEIDDVLYTALIKEGTSKFTANKIWLAVRLFGDKYFNEGRVCDNGVINRHYYNFRH